MGTAHARSNRNGRKTKKVRIVFYSLFLLARPSTSNLLLNGPLLDVRDRCNGTTTYLPSGRT